MNRPQWQRSGAEPDYRFTLANERTFLAWVRTALAVLAGGIVLDQFSAHMEPKPVLGVVAIALSLLAAGMGGFAYFRWQGNEIAMRHRSPLPSSVGIPLPIESR
ncbi:YidH family protein [Cupriavidus sp. a3]|uniref:YidH family protein n=1 Tax=Cupriavidus sp. a3 TaxID=3242158 RepID=UPI003D9C3950